MRQANPSISMRIVSRSTRPERYFSKAPAGVQPVPSRSRIQQRQEGGKKAYEKDDKDDDKNGEKGKSEKDNDEGGMIYMAFAPGTWRVFYAAKLRDGSPASVEHWNAANGNPEIEVLVPGNAGAAGYPPRNQ